MSIGISLIIIGLISMLYAYITYKKADLLLAEIKKEDVVSYYLELALHLIPVPFWCFLGGITFTLIGIIVLLISLLSALVV
ncbi:hypothetical protein SAMN02745221_01449 [Thermosyntropha lipolytica DSM 11003]|uniref:Uncharacterized protein n=1 Tax=Thermosyntropha lipolytica DSM 11003 TaxID=1123382 RepID=A0A1M5PF33_9FIRM|nr:hypothetical protein [Thermosyntropha lipolytica]SHH00109.1 hypothetical protein SAMN02745221_01449 [Thermosyntropha lipolytica DSM 11003]